MNSTFRVTEFFAWAALVAMPLVAAAQEYKSFEEAYRQGAGLASKRQFAESQAPLEAALRLAKDDADKLRVYQALVPAYRQLPEIDKMLEAQDFIMRHTEQRAGRSRAGRDVASFVHQRGKVETAIERYRAQLQTDSKDIAALTVLATLYSGVLRDAEQGSQYKQALEEVDREIATRVAERNEKNAESAPQMAAWYLKEAALAWIEAGDKAKGVAAAKRSAASPPEQRTELLTFYWRDNLGDVFLKAGEPQLAATQFEAASAVAPSESHRTAVAKKLAEAKAAATSTPVRPKP